MKSISKKIHIPIFLITLPMGSLGLISLIWGAMLFLRFIIINSNTTQTEAIITNIESRTWGCGKSRSKNNCVYISYEFTTKDHKKVNGISYASGIKKDSITLHSIGSKIQVRYNELLPTINISGYSSLWFEFFYSLMFIVFGSTI